MGWGPGFVVGSGFGSGGGVGLSQDCWRRLCMLQYGGGKGLLGGCAVHLTRVSQLE